MLRARRPGVASLLMTAVNMLAHCLIAICSRLVTALKEYTSGTTIHLASKWPDRTYGASVPPTPKALSSAGDIKPGASKFTTPGKTPMVDTGWRVAAPLSLAADTHIRAPLGALGW